MNGSVASRPRSDPLASHEVMPTAPPGHGVTATKCASYYGEETEKALKKLLPVLVKREEEIADKLEEFRKFKENFEKLEEKAKTQIRLQYDCIKLQLDTFLDDQMKMLEKVKRDELLNIEQETTKLLQSSQEMKTFEEKGLELLEQKDSLNFITESKTLLNKSHLIEVVQGSPNTYVSASEPVYQRPIYWQAAESEEFRQLIEGQILGHFSFQQSHKLGNPGDFTARNPTRKYQLSGV